MHGESLQSIGFTTDQVGQAIGDRNLLFSTEDGGINWKAHSVGSTIRQFSFADRDHGIITTSNDVLETNGGMLDEVQGPAAVDGVVKVTEDAGAHWKDITALKSDETLKPFTEILSVVALRPTHYLIAFRQPQVAVGYAVTKDAGKTWKLIQVPNVYATRVYAHDGEYWAFGIEYIDRENHGGYGAPVTLHSVDGETWVHGARGPHEFATCTRQGCSLWDGVSENLYGQTVKFLLYPEFGTLSRKWAVALDRICVVDNDLQCSPVTTSDQIPPRPARAKAQ